MWDKKRQIYSFLQELFTVLTRFSGFSAKTHENLWRPYCSGISVDSAVDVPVDARTVFSVPLLQTFLLLRASLLLFTSLIILLLSLLLLPTVTLFDL
jgi:hypothetical protein